MNENTPYQKFFKKELDRLGYASPKDIPNDKKDDFFNKIDRKWKAEKETDESLSRAAYLNGRYASLMERWDD